MGWSRWLHAGVCLGIACGVAASALAADTTAPVVRFDAPTPSATLSGTVAIAASATDAGGVARLMVAIDGTVVASRSGNAVQFDWNTSSLGTGFHTLTATAYDAAWNVGTNTMQVQVADVVAPALAITSPGGALVTGKVSVGASAYDAVGVAKITLSIDGTKAKSLLGSDSLAYSWNTSSLAEGSAHVLAVTASDAAGNATTATRTVSIQDLSGPSIAFASPGPIVTGPVDISVRASDPTGVARIILYRDGAPVAQQPGARLDHPWDVDALPLGTTTQWTAVAVDGSGNSASASVTATVGDATRPVVSIDRPAPGEVMSGLEMVQVSATDDRAVGRLMLFIDGRLVRSETGVNSFVQVWDASERPPGSTSTIWAVATDAAGNTDYASIGVGIEAEGSQPRAPLGLAPSSPGDETRLAPASFAEARGRGAELLYWYQSWAEAAANPGATDALLDQLTAGGAAAVNLDLIHVNVAGRYPPPWGSLTEPGFAAAFSEFAAQLAARHHLEYLFIGNEVNIYLDRFPGQTAALRDLLRTTRQKVRLASPSTRFGVVVSHGYVVDHDQYALLAELGAEVDLVGYTSYGYESNGFSYEFNDPTRGILALEKVPDALPGKPFAIVETGWNSSTDLGSSEADQGIFVRLLLDSMETSSAEFVSLFLYQDGEDCTAIVQGFDLPDLDPDPTSLQFRLFEEFVCHFGLRRSDGTPKQAWWQLPVTP